MAIKNIKSATKKKNIYQAAIVGVALLLIGGNAKYQNVQLEKQVESTFVWESALFNGVYVSSRLIEDINPVVLEAFIKQGHTEFMYMNTANRMTCSYKYSEEQDKWCAIWSDPGMEAEMDPRIIKDIKGLPVNYSYDEEENAVVPEQSVKSIFTKKGDIYFSSLPSYQIDDAVLDEFLRAGNTDYVYRYPYSGTVVVYHYSKELGRWNESSSNSLAPSHSNLRNYSSFDNDYFDYFWKFDSNFFGPYDYADEETNTIGGR